MAEAAKILELYRTAQARGEDCILATVVHVEGSSYRRPGARMLLTLGGQRAGTISGGCLEAEVARRAWWLTESGPAVERYDSSLDEDGTAHYGLGCGGKIVLLLERAANAASVIEAIARSQFERIASAMVTIFAANPAYLTGKRLVMSERGSLTGDLIHNPVIEDLASKTLTERRSCSTTVELDGTRADVFAEYLPSAISLVVFGAGDDAQPLVECAAMLGWQVTIADGRSNLARRERFPSAVRVIAVAGGNHSVLSGHVDAVVIMTHSYGQDKAALTSALSANIPYIGILGPRRRTAQLVTDIAEHAAGGCLARLYSPVGLDIGAETPQAIALSIVAEIHATLRGRNGQPLRNRMEKHD